MGYGFGNYGDYGSDGKNGGGTYGFGRRASKDEGRASSQDFNGCDAGMRYGAQYGASYDVSYGSCNRNGNAFGDVPQDLNEKIARYGNMSREDLMSELLSQAATLRADGRLDFDELNEFCNRAAPFMSAEQLARMRELIKMLAGR